MERERRNGSYGSRGELFFADNGNAVVDRWSGDKGGFTDHSYTNYGHGDSGSSFVKLFPVSPSSSSPSASPSQPQASTSQSGYIQHPVSKFDTLAGIAIRYGVEVADIKKLNGLVTDIQMFALKSVNIPLPGRHPPSNCVSNGSDASGESSSERTPPHRNLFDSFQSLRLKSSSSQEKVSPAMNSLRGYYGLKSNVGQEPQSEVEMAAVYRNGQEDRLFLKTSSTNPPLSRHRKCRSLANNIDEIDTTEAVPATAEAESERWSEKLVRRKQKSEADFTKSIEKKLKEEAGLVGGGSGGGFSPIKPGKGLAQRSSTKQSGGGGGGQNHLVVGLGDSVVGDGNGGGVRKSTSTPSLQDQEMGGSSSCSRWSTSKRSLIPDHLQQALSSAAISRPTIFDGLPKPMSGWKSKAALD